MFTAPRLLVVSLLAALAAALPANLTERALGDISEHEALDIVERATATVYTKCSKPNTVALTFDDGPYKWNGDIVKALNAAGAKGTFFVNGNNYECIYSTANEQRLKTAYKAGHQIASHTWAHLDWKTLSATKLKSEMTRVDDALLKILGVKPAFVRPPYGSYNAQSRTVAGDNGQSIVIWDFDSGDSAGHSTTQQKNDYTALANRKPSNVLTLNHETYQSTVTTTLPHALKVLKAKGYTFVTVAQCLGKGAYAKTQAAKARDSTWKC